MSTRFGEYARERLEAALSGLVDDAPDAQVLADAQLGLMALHMHYGSTEAIALDPIDVMEDVDRREPECTCPPALVARGGFRSSCLVRHGAAA